MSIKGVLFDLDGTVTESAPGIMNSIRHVFQHYGLCDRSDKELQKFVGPPLIESFMRFCGFSEEKAVEAVGVYREYFSTRGLFENSVYDGIPECLESLLKSGLKLGIATSKPQVFCERILEHFDLKKYFRVIVGIPLDDEKMTKAQVIKKALGLLELQPESVLMVGDRDYDIIGAKENGVEGVGVLYGYGSEEELVSAGACAVCATVDGLCREILSRSA